MLKGAGEPWKPDLAQARRDADAVLAKIDWSKRDLMLNVPGTTDHTLKPGMMLALSQVFKAGEVDVTLVEYPTTYNFRRSVPQGMETLRLVLAGIAARGGDHRVYLFGQSQGAILIGEAMADPTLRPLITRAVMWGHPGVSVHHYHENTDPKIWEYSNPEDPISWPTKGSARKWMDDMGRVLDGDLAALPALIGAHLLNFPNTVGYAWWIARGKIIPESQIVDPHGYDHAYDDGFRYLKEAMTPGPVPASALEEARRASEQLQRDIAAGPYPHPLFSA